MYDHLKVGEEVSFPGLLDIKLIVEGVQGRKVFCKYYDDHLKKFIRLTFPIDNLVRVTPTSAPTPVVSAHPDPANDIC
jgi:hypothetical protein